jgi:AcrR family transcriptional regulator
MAKASRKRTTATQVSKGQAIRQAVLETAARLFAERGFGGTNLHDISAELGISRPALYYYFNSKDDILASMVEEITVFSGKRATELVAQADTDPSESLRQLVENHARWLLDHSIEFKMIDRSENDLPAAVRKANDRGKRLVLDNFTRIIAHGIEIGHFRPIDPQVTAFAIIGMCAWTAWWFRADGRMSSAQVAQLIADLAVHAVRHGPGAQNKSIELADAVRNLRDDLALLERVIARRTGKPG